MISLPIWAYAILILVVLLMGMWLERIQKYIAWRLDPFRKFQERLKDVEPYAGPKMDLSGGFHEGIDPDQIEE